MIPADEAAAAPELQVSEWLNADAPISLASLRGRVVVIEAFQMLCPGCILHGIPQAQTVQRTFAGADVTVLGLHTVFEHHAAMAPVSLSAFLHEFAVTFPVGVDAAGDGPVPRTMAAYGQRGTPALWIVDRVGRLRAHHLGQVSDIVVGVQVAALLGEGPAAGPARTVARQDGARDGGMVCSVDEAAGPSAEGGPP